MAVTWKKPPDAAPAYLADLFAESYKREADQDEAVWRTLPFFATALTGYGGLLAFAISRLPHSSPDPWTNVGYLLATGAVVCGFASVGWLWFAVFPKEYCKIPQDKEIYAHYLKCKKHFEKQHKNSNESDYRTMEELRDLMISEFSSAVSHNRENNRKRYKGRVWAANFFVAGLIFTALIAVGSAWHEKIDVNTKGNKEKVVASK